MITVVDFASGFCLPAVRANALVPLGRHGLWERAAGAGFEGLDPDDVVITFDEGDPVAIDGETVTPLEAITELNRRAGAHGIGRCDTFEAPGATVLITAHRELENRTIEGDLLRFKRSVDQRWAELVRDGLWSSPLKDALDAFIAETQKHVSGEVRLTLHQGRATIKAG